MRTYDVYLSISGSVCVSATAVDEESAIDRAIDQFVADNPDLQGFDIEVSESMETDDYLDND